jgi:hypothetical protein
MIVAELARRRDPLASSFAGDESVARFAAFTAIVSLAALAAACSDSVTAVPSSIRSTGAAFDIGNPPPPPLTGGGDAVFEFGESDASINSVAAASTTPAVACIGNTDFLFTFTYLVNTPDNNSVLHLNQDGSDRPVTMHETDGKFDAHGVIVGPNFTFTITQVIDGELTPIGTDVTNAPTTGQDRFAGVSFDLDAIGTATFSDGSTCQTTGHLSGRGLVGSTPGV